MITLDSNEIAKNRMDNGDILTKTQLGKRFKQEFYQWFNGKIQNHSGVDFSYFVGLDKRTFSSYIESHFQDQYTWKTYGESWHIDHIVPFTFFNPNETEDMKLCWNFVNLRPLGARKNIQKGNSYWESLMDLEKRLNVAPANEILHELRKRVLSRIIPSKEIDLSFLSSYCAKSAQYQESTDQSERYRSCKRLIIS